MHKFRMTPVLILAFASMATTSAWAVVVSPASASTNANGSYTVIKGTKTSTLSLSESDLGDRVEVSASKNGNGFVASAEATSGALKAFASTTYVPSTDFWSYTISNATASASFTDYVTFTGGTGVAEGSFLASLSGVLSGGGYGGSAGYLLSVKICDTSSVWCGFFGGDSLVADSHSVSGRSKLTINNEYETGFDFEFGKTYQLVASLSVNAENGGIANFADTADLSFAMGNGVALTSASGYQYDVPAVPEPKEYAMMLSGLGMLGLMAFRRKK